MFANSVFRVFGPCLFRSWYIWLPRYACRVVGRYCVRVSVVSSACSFVHLFVRFFGISVFMLFRSCVVSSCMVVCVSSSVPMCIFVVFRYVMTGVFLAFVIYSLHYSLVPSFVRACVISSGIYVVIVNGMS